MKKSKIKKPRKIKAKKTAFKAIEKLPAKKLYVYCDSKKLGFKDTSEISELTEAFGHKRAIDAIKFGINIRKKGFNLFVLGSPGLGKHLVVDNYIKKVAPAGPSPNDWCYVYNFHDPSHPRAISLSPGKGKKLQKEMDHFIDEVKSYLPAVFDSENYRAARTAMEKDLKNRQDKVFSQLQKEAKEKNTTIVQTSVGFAFAPLKGDHVITGKEFDALPEKEKQKIGKEISKLEKKLKDLVDQIPREEKNLKEQIKELDRKMIKNVVGDLIERLRKEYASYSLVLTFLEEVEKDIILHARDFLMAKIPLDPMLEQMIPEEHKTFEQYKVNVLLDNSKQKGSPVIYVDDPNFQNLVGRIEYISKMGAMVTSFNLIRKGAFHQANGGYLIVDARKILFNLKSWDAIKSVIRSREIKITSLGQEYSLISTVSLEPEPIPADFKIIIIGDRLIYYLLAEYDLEFPELFKVIADFDDRIERTSENISNYSRLIATIIKKEKLKHFSADAVGRIIEQSSRLSGDGERLSLKVRAISDLVRESDHWAEVAGDNLVKRTHVDKAIEGQIKRGDRIRDLYLEEMVRGTILINTHSFLVGQINGLSVMVLGEQMFGFPSRITARVSIGKGSVLDIEREVELGGPIHSKGVLILHSYLNSRYARDIPLSISASLVFEQSYGGVEGDSASAAELVALLSAIAEVPIKQNIAITGSVNQNGEVQAIGGVNEKIEGFFDLCKARGLTGDQGVIIPYSNIKNLMLRKDVVEAVEKGKFNIYPAKSIDQCIKILADLSPGEPRKDGKFPKGTFNNLVQNRLGVFFELMQKQLGMEKKIE